MADPVVIVEKIVDMAFAIKEAVETVRENKEECHGIEHRVHRVSDLLSLLKESEMMMHQAVSAPLEDLKDAVSHAHEVITACQGRNILCLCCKSGKLAKKLRKVKDDIAQRIMLAIFATGVAIFVVTKSQHSAQPPFFVSMFQPPRPLSEHVPSPPSPVVVVEDIPPSLPIHPPLSPSPATVVGEDLLHATAHIPPPPPPPPPPPRLAAYIPPPPPPPLSKHVPTRPLKQPPPPPPSRLAAYIPPSTRPPPPSPPPPPSLTPRLPPTVKKAPPLSKHQPSYPPTQPIAPSLPHSTPENIAPPLPGHIHPHPSSHLPPRSSAQSTTDVLAPVGSLSSISAEDVSGKSEVEDERKKLVPAASEAPSILPGLTKFSLSELKVATRNFSEENKIESSDIGTVYKGVLQDGLVVAINEFRDPPQFLVLRICAELHLASELQSGGKGENTHSEKNENIIRVLGYALEFMPKDRRVESHIFLIKEYMPNGSMSNIIYGSRLDWSSRFRIIQGLAWGLQYLHEQNIVHMNVKPANILLDSDMNPKITDFGIARMLDKRMIRDKDIAGTVGYMPPEYILEGILSTKFDVYSFGVILLETISGMCRAEPARHQASVQWAWKMREYQELDELFDPSFYDESQQMEIKRCMEIGLLCTQFEWAERPTMQDVIELLNGKKELLTPKQPEYTKERSMAAKRASHKVRSRR